MSTRSGDILSERLILRPPVPEDVHVVNRELAKWETSRMLARVPFPFTPQDPDTWFEERRKRMFPAKGLWRMLSRREDAARTCIGNLAVCPDDEGIWDVGYWLSEEVQGQGLMTEALTVALSHIDETWGPKEIVSGAFTDNPASRRVLEKAGFQLSGTTSHWCEARQSAIPHWNFNRSR